MRIGVLIILFLVCISCKKVTEKETEQVQVVVDSTELKIKTIKKQTGGLKLNSFLENPIDLKRYKELKKINVTTSVTNGMKYHFHPKINDSIFYIYYYPTENIIPKEIDQVVVFKYGKNKQAYDDETEILIGLNIFNQDSDLGKANLVGRTKSELESEFGSDYLILGNKIIYSNKNKVLILEIENSIIKSFNYIKLNTEKIDNDLIRLILE